MNNKSTFSRRDMICGLAAGVILAPSFGTAFGNQAAHGTGLDVTSFGAVGDGSHDDLGAFKQALSQLQSQGGGTLTGPSKTYFFNIASDNDSLSIPSNTTLNFPKGTIFSWNYVGSPLIVLVNTTNCTIQGITFQWSGLLKDIPGGSTQQPRYGWGGALPNRDFCANVLALGAENLTIRDCKGEKTNQTSDLGGNCYYEFASFHAKKDGSLSKGNRIENCEINDAVIAMMMTGQQGLVISNITSKRFPGDHPVGGAPGLPGHILYTAITSLGYPYVSNLDVSNIFDEGQVTGKLTTAARLDSTIQLKHTEKSNFRNVRSNRPTGILTMGSVIDSTFDQFLYAPKEMISHAVGFMDTQSKGNYVERCKFTNFTIDIPRGVEKSAFVAANPGRIKNCYIQAKISAGYDNASMSVIAVRSEASQFDISFNPLTANTIHPVMFLDGSFDSHAKVALPARVNRAKLPTNGVRATTPRSDIQFSQQN